MSTLRYAHYFIKTVKVSRKGKNSHKFISNTNSRAYFFLENLSQEVRIIVLESLKLENFEKLRFSFATVQTEPSLRHTTSRRNTETEHRHVFQSTVNLRRTCGERNDGTSTKGNWSLNRRQTSSNVSKRRGSQSNFTRINCPRNGSSGGCQCHGHRAWRTAFPIIIHS